MFLHHLTESNNCTEVLAIVKAIFSSISLENYCGRRIGASCYRDMKFEKTSNRKTMDQRNFEVVIASEVG